MRKAMQSMYDIWFNIILKGGRQGQEDRVKMKRLLDVDYTWQQKFPSPPGQTVCMTTTKSRTRPERAD